MCIIYIYIYIYKNIQTYIYIYIYTDRERAIENKERAEWRLTQNNSIYNSIS